MKIITTISIITILAASILLWIPLTFSDTVVTYIEPVYLEVRPGQEFIIKIKIDPGGKGVSGGEVEVNFNPNIFEVISVNPGDILGPSPLVGLREIDNVKGSIRYAIARVGRTELPTKPGVFAEIQFKTKFEANTGTYTIELVRIGLADEEFNDITEISIDNGSVEVKITRGTPPTTTTEMVTETATTRETETMPTTPTTETTLVTTSPYVTSTPYYTVYTYTTTVVAQTPPTIYLVLATTVILFSTMVVGVLAITYMRRRRKPRILGVGQESKG